MSEKQENTKQRVQFDFSPESLRRLEDLKKKTDASTKAEVVRDALKLYEWFVNQVDPSYVVEIEDKDGHNIFRIPASTLL